MDLNEARAEIRRTDLQMRDLFLHRMEAASHVAEWKRQEKLPVEDPAQEKRVIEALSPAVEDETLRALYERFLHGVMEVSKDWQRHLLETPPDGQD